MISKDLRRILKYFWANWLRILGCNYFSNWNLWTLPTPLNQKQKRNFMCSGFFCWASKRKKAKQQKKNWNYAMYQLTKYWQKKASIIIRRNLGFFSRSLVQSWWKNRLSFQPTSHSFSYLIKYCRHRWNHKDKFASLFVLLSLYDDKLPRLNIKSMSSYCAKRWGK